MFKTDDHFLIGDAHVRAGTPCQDYALSGHHGSIAYAIVSDGCSTGGLTDVGSRLVSLTMAAAIREHVSRSIPLLAEDLARTQGRNLEKLRTELPLSTNDMLATCGYICLEPNGGFASVRGDGVVALKWIDGSITLHRFEWANNVPFYPAYLPERKEGFMKAHVATAHAALAEEVWSYAPERGFVHVATRTHSLSEGMNGIILPIAHIEPLAFAAVFSDGVSQVEGVDWKDAVRELLAFKAIGGLFAKRRMIRFVGDAKENGKGPDDDIAYAVIRVASNE